jgi:hypothetical protein
LGPPAAAAFRVLHVKKVDFHSPVREVAFFEFTQSKSGGFEVFLFVARLVKTKIKLLEYIL